MKKKTTRKIRKNKRATTQRRKNRSYKRMRGGLTFTSEMISELTPNSGDNLASVLFRKLRNLCYEPNTKLEDSKNVLAVAKQTVEDAVNANPAKKQILVDNFAELFKINIANVRTLTIPDSNRTLDLNQQNALDELCKLYNKIYSLSARCLPNLISSMLDGNTFREGFEYILTGKIFIKKLPLISMPLDEVDVSIATLTLILSPNFLGIIIPCLLEQHNSHDQSVIAPEPVH